MPTKRNAKFITSDSVEHTEAQAPISRFGHYIILDHDSVFSEVPGHVERWDCHVTYAIDLGYGYSRGPFRLRITLQPDPIHEHKWITYLDIIAL